MNIWEYISFTKFVPIKKYNDWNINCDLTKFHRSLSTLILLYFKGFNVRRGFLELLFLPKFQNNFLTNVWWSLYHTSDITKFQTHLRIQSSPTIWRVLFYRGIDESRDRFKHLMQSEPRGKAGRFFDITRITWLYRHHIIRSSEMQKIQLSMWPKKVIYVFLFGR